MQEEFSSEMGGSRELHAGSGTVFDTRRVGAQVPLIIFHAAE